jgi:(S)-mandelate dehydrogenase
MIPGAGPSLPPSVRDGSVAQLEGSPKRKLYRGRNPSRAVSIEDLRAMAHRRLPRFALEYLEAGAGREHALAANLEAFACRRLVRRALVDGAGRDPGVILFGRRIAFPLLIAPTGLNGVFIQDADCRLARAAARSDVPFVQSSMSNDSVEDVAAAAPGLRHWFQLYVCNPPEITEGLVDQAAASGCEALIVTTDAQFFGKRSWSEREQSSKTRLRTAEMLNALLHPRWLATTMLPWGQPRFRNFSRWLPDRCSGIFESAFWIRGHMDRGLDWRRLGHIRERWRGKLLVKGILAPDDAERAAREGMDGIVISNHGGRQIDASVAALDMLAPCRAAAGESMVVLVDGGVRSGSDIVKALALGADAVLAGRAPLYGLGAAGEPGVDRALTILKEEFLLTLGLIGCPSALEVNGSILA